MKTTERNERLMNAYKQIARANAVMDILYTENLKNPVPSEEYKTIYHNLIEAICNMQIVLRESIKIEENEGVDLCKILRDAEKKAVADFRA